MDKIGGLEEIVMLIVLAHQSEAYGVLVAKEYKNRVGRSISVPAIHAVLKRLEKKGFLDSKMGDATPERGGKRKRLFEVTPHGYQVLVEWQQTRAALWAEAPKLGFN